MMHQIQEYYRPSYHFTPPSQWMNDPNGLVFFEGEYHLFYQYHPDSTVWGPMHWGHAVSPDLVRWEHLPIAIAPDENGMIFSGSAVVDNRNTSGFFEGGSGLVAIFTHADGDCQRQSIAYSKDKGRTWTMYEGNPVLEDEAYADFRDPKVIWHTASQRWVMVLAAGDHVRIYTSNNLKAWEFASEFGRLEGSHDGVWECPDLFELPIEGLPGVRRWVMVVSIGDGGDKHPEGSRTQYFIGDFDGFSFTTNPAEASEVKWIDFGRDNYAGITWSDIPEDDGRRILIGWMSNWKYAGLIPTESWRGTMTLPRVLSLRATNEGIQLFQSPVESIAGLRRSTHSWDSVEVVPNCGLLEGVYGDAFEIEAAIELMDAAEIGFKLRVSETEETVVGYDTGKRELFIDRTRSGKMDFHNGFPVRHGAPLKLEENRIRLRIFVDSSSVEVFAENGQVVITDLIFPDPRSDGMEIYATGGKAKIISMRVSSLSI